MQGAQQQPSCKPVTSPCPHMLPAPGSLRTCRALLAIAEGTAMALMWQWLPPLLRSFMYRSNPTSCRPDAAKQLRRADKYLHARPATQHGMNGSSEMTLRNDIHRALHVQSLVQRASMPTACLISTPVMAGWLSGWLAQLSIEAPCRSVALPANTHPTCLQ